MIKKKKQVRAKRMRFPKTELVLTLDGWIYVGRSSERLGPAVRQHLVDLVAPVAAAEVVRLTEIGWRSAIRGAEAKKNIKGRRPRR